MPEVHVLIFIEFSNFCNTKVNFKYLCTNDTHPSHLRVSIVHDVSTPPSSISCHHIDNHIILTYIRHSKKKKKFRLVALPCIRNYLTDTYIYARTWTHWKSIIALTFAVHRTGYTRYVALEKYEGGNVNAFHLRYVILVNTITVT